MNSKLRRVNQTDRPAGVNNSITYYISIDIRKPYIFSLEISFLRRSFSSLFHCLNEEAPRYSAYSYPLNLNVATVFLLNSN